MAQKTFFLEIVCPEGIFFEGPAVMAQMLTSEGQIGVYAGHIPMTCLLEPGPFHIIKAQGRDVSAELKEGFVEILPQKLTVLTEGAQWQR